ncbi:hypothetical protein GCM10023205_37110 [Yinghuangia aomiensis]|uniref:HTH tetR-type domain-containing protein n=1 Tax=Yinghuangia aomiensis TaxID=676205 RepID=A0ABP9HDW2_9ACTN
MPRDGSTTRERLIAAAEQVFAEQGVEQASLVDIHKLAGQANKSALHYHFGSREDLLRAVLARHVARVSPVRRGYVDAMTARQADGTEPTVAELLTALVQPLADQMHTESGRYCVRIAGHMRTIGGGFRRHGAFFQDAPEELPWIYDRLADRLDHLPERLRIERLAVWNDMVAATLADWAATAGTEGTDAVFTADELVVNLVDMGTAALLAPSRLS